MKRAFLLFLVCLLVISFALAEIPANQDDRQEEVVIVVSEGRKLVYGDKGEDVKQLQTRLKDLRYYNGPVSGNYLEVTRKAVRAVQEAYGLKVTGEADLALQELIYGDAHRPLKKGDTGKDVSRLQTRLSEIGYYWGKISGNYLDGTFAAVEAFQRENGLEATGVADVPTLLKLYSDDILLPAQDPDKTPAPLPTPPPDVKYTGKLSYGSKGEQVKLVQERLAVLGFFDRKVTGGFYRHTQQAVKDFQHYNGLNQNGVVDEDTWDVLFSLDVVRSDGIPKPSPTPAPIPYFVEVDVNNQLIKVFGLDEYGQHTKLEKVFYCSTGTKSYPSRPGIYTLSGRRSKWAHFPNWGGGTARWWLMIDGEIAFHSIIYADYDLTRPNMTSVRKLGSPASHGCIRLTLADAKWMYDNIGAGTRVFIHEEAAMDPELKAAHKPGEWNKKTFVHNPTPAPTQEPVYDGTRVPVGKIRTLKIGISGEDVFWLQHKLKEMGYYSGTVTGTYLDGTKAAVRAFQKAQGLSVSGTADVKTLETLYKLVAISTTPAPTPLPTDPPQGLAVPESTPAPTDFQVNENAD